MKKLLSLFWLLLLATSLAHAQTTVVSATVLDPNSGPYARGTWLVTFVPNPNSAVPPTLNGSPFTKQFNGTTDATGAFTVTVADNTIVNPQGSQWIFQICSFGVTCFQYQTSISGATLDLSSALSAHSTPIMGNTLLNARGFGPADNGLKVVGAQGQSACLMDYFDAQGNLLLCLTGTGTLTCVSGCGGSGGNTVGPGTINTFAYFDSATTIKTGPLSFDPINNETFSTNSLSQPSSDYPCINSASGTTTGLLVTTDSNGNCINIANGQITNIVGVAHYGAGTTGTVQVAQIGNVPIIFDNQTIIGDCAIPAATGAQAHDSGSQTCPGGPQTVGRVTSLNAGVGTAANVRVFISDVTSIPAGPPHVIQVTGVTLAGTTANFNNTTPAAGANQLLCTFQTDNATPISNVSLECPQATASQNGFIRLAGDLNGGSAAAPTATGIQTIPVTFTSPAARDTLCFPTSSTLANCQLGVPVRTVAGNSDAILTTDRVSDVRYTAASGATPVTLSQAGTTGFASNFTTVLTNAQGSGTVTVTATTSTFNGGGNTLAIPAGNYCFIYSDNTNYFNNCGTISGAGGGVTSVGLSVPSEFSVSGSPVTSSGTILVTKATENPNLVWASPAAQSTSNIVQSGSLACAAASCALATSANITAGDLLIVYGQCGGGCGGTPTVSDTLTQTFVSSLSSPGVTNVWFICSSAGGADTITISAGGSTSTQVTYIEVSGNATTSCKDTSSATTAFSGNSPGATFNSLTTTGSVAQSSELVFGFWYGLTTTRPATLNPGGGFVSLQSPSITVGGILFQTLTEVGTTNQGLSGTQTATSGATGNWDTSYNGLVLTFKLSSTGNGIPVFRKLTIADLPVHSGTLAYCTNTFIPAAITSTTAESVFNFACQIPASVLSSGSRIAVSAYGISTMNGVTDTLTIKVKICQVLGCGSGTVLNVGTTGAITPGVTTANEGWKLTDSVIDITPGSANTSDAQGFASFSTALGTAQQADLQNASTVSFNDTVLEYVQLSSTASVSSDSVQLRNIAVVVQ